MFAKSKSPAMPRPITYFSLSFSRPNFTGKETDCETGYSYFGARYYDATLLTGWTAVDPMADKYPSLSPYNYCAWNPMKIVDPDGRDWYQNVYSGAVYYNSDIHGDKCAGTGDMKGNGWVLLGENDMFKENENDIFHSGLTLAASNGGSINQVIDNPYDFSERNTHIRGELMLEGDKAENFMKSQGYKKMPLLAKVNVMIVTQNISEGDGSVYVQKDDQSYVSKVYSTTYVKNPPRNPRYSVKKTTPWKDDINIVRSISSRTEIRQYDYSRGNNWDIIEAGLSIIARLMSGL